MKKTNRGFPIYSQFKDTYNANITVQMSSSVLKRCWIFIQDGEIEKNSGSAHLSEAQAKRIIEGLKKFIKDD